MTDALLHEAMAGGECGDHGQWARTVFSRNDPALLRRMPAESRALRQLPTYGARYPTSRECLDVFFEHDVDPNITSRRTGGRAR
jgi:hypothetical protein